MSEWVSGREVSAECSSTQTEKSHRKRQENIKTEGTGLMMKSLCGNAGCHSLFKEVGLIRPSMLPIKDNATWVFSSFPSSANVYVNHLSSA